MAKTRGEAYIAARPAPARGGAPFAMWSRADRRRRRIGRRDQGARTRKVDTERTRTDPAAAPDAGDRAPAVLVVAAPGALPGVRGALDSDAGGFRVAPAGGVDEAAALLGSRLFDAVVVALAPSDPRPLDTVRRLRALAGSAALLVSGLPAIAPAALAAGADEWIGDGDPPAAVAARVRHAAERRELRRELDASDARFRSIIERAADGIVIVGHDGRVRFVNPAAERMFGRSAAQLAGEHFGFAVLAGETTEMDLLRQGGGEPIVAELRASATTWEGEPAQVISLRDVTDRKRAEERAWRLELERSAREQAERASARSHFLAEAGSVLDSSLDPEVTLRNLARLIVPRMADACLVDLLERGRIRRVAAVHDDDGERQELVDRLAPATPREPDDWPPAARVLRTGDAELHRGLDAARRAELAGGGETAELLERIGARSMMTVALPAREGRLGAITFLCGERDFEPADLELAEEVASRAGRALENARLYVAALAASRAKSDFLTVMSHELRTPLNAILGYAALLLEGIGGDVDGPRREHLERIAACGTHLLQLIDEILNYTQIEAGGQEARPGGVTLGELVRDVAAGAEPLAAEKGLELHVEVPDPSAELFTDAGKLRQITRNLLGNAVKFTGQGSVSLHAEVRDGELALSVSDTGPGIAPADLERIYEPFWQAEEPLTRHAGGTGLGLSVSMRLAQLLGGTLTAESRPGHGSTFILRVPARMPGAAPRP
jgi:signal transduction histidine kinase